MRAGPFQRKEVGRILKMSGSQIQLYTDSGTLRADGDPERGTGFARLYSLSNLVELSLIRHLGGFGIKLRHIKEIISVSRRTEAVRQILDPESGALDSGTVFLVVLDPAKETLKTVVVWRKVGEPMDLSIDMQGREVALVVNVTGLWGDIKARL